MGDSWLTDKCVESCKCERGGKINCKDHSCHAESVCDLDKYGNIYCRPASELTSLCDIMTSSVSPLQMFCQLFAVFTFSEFDRCQISGDPHYRTFDAFSHHFQGPYTYVLTQGYNLQSNQPPLLVRGKNIRRGGNRKISFLDEVYTDVYGVYVRFRQKKIVLVSFVSDGLF